MEATDTPRQRADLDLTPITDADRTLTVVHDPRSGRYFRIREVEGFILSRLDGSTPLTEVREAVLREFPGVSLSVETVVKFVEKLNSLGWLEGGGAVGYRPPAVPWFRKLARMKLPPVPAEGLFRTTLPLVRFLYHPVVATCILLAVLWAGFNAFFVQEEFLHARPHVATASGFAASLVGLFTIGVIHELGHGMTCRFYGARSNGIGFFIMYGLPCFYCDVSGAWTLSNRYHRMAIGAAGLAWQFVAGAVAFVLWSALEPSTFPARVCHSMMSACGVMALVNLNPFLKLDGYYLLSDWLEIPNLREKALRYFNGQAAWLFLGAERPTLGNPRERRIFFWFGLTSGFYTLALVVLVLWRLSYFALHAWHAWGALLIGILLMSILGSWFKGVFSRTRQRRGGPSAPAAPPSAPQGTPPTGGEPEKKVRKRWVVWPKLRLLATLSALGAAAWWFWNAKWSFFVVSPCALEAEQRVAVRPMVDGVLQEIRFREGERIRQGDTFAILETDDLVTTKRQLAQKAKAVEAMSGAIEKEAPFLSGERERDVVQAQEGLQTARADLGNMESEFLAKRKEAMQQVDAANRAYIKAQQVASRLRADEDAIADGRPTPSMQSLQEKIARVHTQLVLADREFQRAAFLVKEGALQRQKLDSAKTEMEVLQREEESLKSDMAALRKELREQREDADAEAQRLLAELTAAQSTSERVAAETRDDKLAAQRATIASREAALARSMELRGEGQVKTAEAAAKRLEAEPIRTEMSRVERKIKETRVASPAEGIISTPRLQEKVGKRFYPGETLAWIDRLDTLKAKILVDEREISYVKRGQTVQFRVGAFPDRPFEAKVREIATRPIDNDGKTVYEVGILVGNPEGDLRPGIKGHAKLIAGERPLREVVFRKLYRYFRTEVWTWF